MNIDNLKSLEDTKPKSASQTLKESLEFLDKSKEATEDLRFNFACFVDSFKRFIEKKEKEI